MPTTPAAAQALKQSLSRQLFMDTAANAYAVLDGASNPALLDHLYGDRPDFVCLYRGELAPDIAECAPYLARLLPGEPFCDWLLDQCWGRHWGIFATSRVDLRALCQHLRKFNMVFDPEGNRPLLFRYYDPRVLRIFLPTCEAGQLAEFFGPVEAFFAEPGEGESLARFCLDGQGGLLGDVCETADETAC